VAAFLLSSSPAGGQASTADLALLVAARELADMPKGVNTKSTVCVGLGEKGLTQEQLRSLRTGVPRVSLKAYTIECLVPVTEFLYVRVLSPNLGSLTRVVAQWSRKADATCFSDGIRRRVYEAMGDTAGWRITSTRDEKPGRGTPKP
jgi:hypothetical protein